MAQTSLMKTRALLSFLGILFFSLLACSKSDKQTSVSGSMYSTDGTLASQDTFYIHINSGYPNGGWGSLGVNKVKEIACLLVSDGNYKYSFTAEYNEYLWMQVYKKNARPYGPGDHLGTYEIYPGENQIIDVFQEQLSWLRIRFSDNEKFKNLRRIYIDPYSLNGHSGSYMLYADSLSFPYDFYLSGIKSAAYHIAVNVQTDEFYQSYFFQNNFPNADTTVLDFSL